LRKARAAPYRAEANKDALWDCRAPSEYQHFILVAVIYFDIAVVVSHAVVLSHWPHRYWVSSVGLKDERIEEVSPGFGGRFIFKMMLPAARLRRRERAPQLLLARPV
jgi:hypothetical protein